MGECTQPEYTTSIKKREESCRLLRVFLLPIYASDISMVIPADMKAINGLQRVVHVELGRMRGHAHALHVLHLEFDVGIDHAVAEHPAAGQEFAVLVQRVER